MTKPNLIRHASRVDNSDPFTAARVANEITRTGTSQVVWEKATRQGVRLDTPERVTLKQRTQPYDS